MIDQEKSIEIKEILVKQIFSDAFEEMLKNCEDFVKEQVLIEKSRIYADGYFKAINDVLDIVNDTKPLLKRRCQFDKGFELAVKIIRDGVVELKGEQE